MGVVLVLVLLAIYAAWRIYGNRYLAPTEEASRFGPRLHHVVSNKYFVDEAYFALVVRPLLALTRGLARFDKLVIDGVVNATGFAMKVTAWVNGAIDRVFVDGLVNQAAAATLFVGQRLRRVQTGQVQAYVVGIMGALVAIWVVFYLVQT